MFWKAKRMTLLLRTNDGKESSSNDVFMDAVQLLNKVNIIAIKGVGGFHLACDARNEQVVEELRKREKRKDKPFALMAKDIDAIKLLVYKDIIVATFGDMMRVKGTETSLERSGSKDRKPIIVYSPFDVIEIARSNRDKMVVFLAVCFETTASAIASLVKHAEEKSINNINVMTSIRLMPPILEKVLQQHNGRLHGIICPGHVATIMGEVFKVDDGLWRGIGSEPASALVLKEQYAKYDAA